MKCLYKFKICTRLVRVFTTFAVGGWEVGELESNAKHSFQLLGQKNVGQKILRPQKFGSNKFGQNQVSSS